MSKKFKLLTVFATLVVILIVAVAGTALAADPQNTDDAVQDCRGQGWGGYNWQGTSCSETASELGGDCRCSGSGRGSSG